MIRVIVADFDSDNLKNFKAFIKSNFTDFKFEKSVSSLEEIQNIIKNKKADLIIADIRIFGTNVISLFKDWNTYNPEITFILYGTFNDADYMQKCMEYGSAGYMYKPVKPGELEKNLNIAKKIYENKKRKLKEEGEMLKSYKENIMFFETLFLKNLTNGTISDEREIENGFDYLNIDIKPPYSVAVLRIDHFKKVVLAFDEGEKHIFIFRILNKINKIISGNNRGKAFINNFNEIIMIIYGFNELEEIMRLLNEVKIEVQISINLGVSIGVGGRYENIKDISVSYREAVAALKYRCFTGYNSIIPREYVEPGNDITYRYPIEREELLVYTAVIGEYDYCVKLLNEIFDSLRKSSDIKPKLLSQIVTDILISINRNAIEQNLNVSGINQFFPTSVVFEIKTLDDAYNYLKNGLNNFCSHIIKIRNEKETEIFNSAIDYINNKYYEDINAKKIASLFNCSYEYFKKLFKKYSEVNFSDYLTKIRIEKSKDFILSSNADDEIVALKVGYEDVTVFRANFKRIEGYATSDFRHLNNRNDNNN